MRGKCDDDFERFAQPYPKWTKRQDVIVESLRQRLQPGGSSGPAGAVFGRGPVVVDRVLEPLSLAGSGPQVDSRSARGRCK